MKKQYKKKVLYISYDGLLEPLGKSQILEYLKVLSKKNSFYVISFEKKSDINNKTSLQKLQKELKDNNIIWKSYIYSNKKNLIYLIKNYIISSSYILFLLFFLRIKIIHIRSYIPGFILFPYLYLSNIKLIFDMRGFLPLEKIERENWKQNEIKLKLLKNLEKYLIKRSSKIVTLTNESKKIINRKFKINNNKIEVIPTCVNVNRFKISNNKKISDRINLCFLGSVNQAYDFDRIVEFSSNLIKFNKKYFINFYINDKKDYIKKKLSKNKIDENRFNIEFIKAEIISQKLNSIDIGFFFLKKNNSIKAAFPTKIGEFLSKGIPIICNNFNEDINNIMSKNDLGIMVIGKKIDYKKISKQIDKFAFNYIIKKNCRNFAKNNLSISFGASKYLKIYKNIENN